MYQVGSCQEIEAKQVTLTEGITMKTCMGGKKFSSIPSGSLLLPEKQTDKDRLTREKHIYVVETLRDMEPSQGNEDPPHWLELRVSQRGGMESGPSWGSVIGQGLGGKHRNLVET